MRNLQEAWPAICDFSVRLDLPPSRWKYAWSTHEFSAKRLYNAIRWRQPKIIVETGTFEGLGTFTMAKAAQENANEAKIFTIDYDGDPDVSIPMEDWLQLRHFRDENLDLARAKFPSRGDPFPQRRFPKHAALRVPGPIRVLGFLFSGFDALHEWNPCRMGNHEAFCKAGLRGGLRRRLS